LRVQPPQQTAKYAFVTLAVHTETGDPRSVSRGTKTLGKSLQSFAAHHGVDMIAICYNLSDVLRLAVEDGGWTCRDSEWISNPVTSKLWNHVYNKLHVLSMVEYEKVIYLDSDIVMVSPLGLSELLTTPIPERHFGAVLDCPSCFRTGVCDEMNSGMLVVRPSMTMFREHVNAVPKVESHDRSDQGFWASLMKGNITWLPAKFNYQRWSFCIKAINRSTGLYELDKGTVDSSREVSLQEAQQLARSDVDEGNVVFAHYLASRPKPWGCLENVKLEECGQTWAAGSSNIPVLNGHWIKCYNLPGKNWTSLTSERAHDHPKEADLAC